MYGRQQREICDQFVKYGLGAEQGHTPTRNMPFNLNKPQQYFIVYASMLQKRA